MEYNLTFMPQDLDTMQKLLAVLFLIKEAVENWEIQAVGGQYDTYRMVASK